MFSATEVNQPIHDNLELQQSISVLNGITVAKCPRANEREKNTRY